MSNHVEIEISRGRNGMPYFSKLDWDIQVKSSVYEREVPPAV